MSFILNALKVVVLIGVLIFIHEFGHFAVAKMLKIKVHKFSIGFGPKIFYKNGKETEYSLRLLPLGGFVQLEGEDADSEDENSFSKKSCFQRSLVLLAGITMNLLLAFFIFLGINMYANVYYTTEISSSNSGDILSNYGLEVGDTIEKINGEKVYNYSDLTDIISNNENDNFIFEIKNKDGTNKTKLINIPKKQYGLLGIYFYQDGTVHSTIDDSVASKKGIRAGDTLIGINDDEVNSSNLSEELAFIRLNPNQEYNLKFNRSGDIVEYAITPTTKESRDFEISFVKLTDLDFFDNFCYAFEEVRYYFKCMGKAYVEIFAGNSEDVDVEGIVGISSEIAKTQNVLEFLVLMGGLSFSLAIMNLLPIPGLDGGKLLFVIIEAIRKKPVAKENEMKYTLIGFIFIITLTIIVTVSDISKLL